MQSKYSKLLRQFVTRIETGAFQSTDRHPSSYAYEIPDILERLHFGRFKSAREYLETKDLSFQRQLRRFEDTSAAATYSPHRPLDDSPYFVETDTLEDLDVLLPYPDGSPKATHVVHIGPKGSGKTTIQNHWLRINHEKLENARILYVRCDAPKIFEFWERNIENPNDWTINSLPTIEEYLDFQTLYIIAKYRHSGLPGDIFTGLKLNDIFFDFKEAKAIDEPARSKKLVSWYLEEHIAKNIDIFERGDPDKSYIRDALFIDKPTKRREYFRWKECASAVRRWLREAGYSTLRILDGVDNLHLNTESGKKIFDAFIPEIRNFILRAAPLGETRFAVMRNRTWIEVLKRDPITLGSGSIVNPRTIYHIPPKASAVSANRIAWLRGFSDAEDCAKTLEAATLAMPSGEILHQNMRTLIVGTSSLAEQVRFRHHQLGGQADSKRQAIIQMKRNLFLNGRFYLSTQRDFPSMNREKGLPYINPFWIPDDLMLKPEGRDPLFLRVRILELLHTGDLLDQELKRILNQSFGFSIDAVNLAIDDSRAFGWIDSKSELAGISNITYEISETGRYLLTDLLCDVDVLYMLALDTRLPKSLFARKLIQVHSNHVHQRSGYIGAAAVTVFTFVSWLAQLQKSELSEVDLKSINGSYKREFLSKAALRRISAHFYRTIRHGDENDWLLISDRCSELREADEIHSSPSRHTFQSAQQ